MKDSSSVINQAITDSSYLRFDFDNPGKFSSSISPINTTKFSIFTITSEKIKILETGALFLIEKLSTDSLILLEANSFNLPDDKIKRFYFKPESILIKDELKKQNFRDTLIANKHLTPRLKISIGEIIGDRFRKLEKRGTVIGKFIISKDKTIVEIEKAEEFNKSQVNKITTILESFHKEWHFPDSLELKIFIIPFYLNIDFKKTYSTLYTKGGIDTFQDVRQFGNVNFIPYTQKPSAKIENQPKENSQTKRDFEDGVKLFLENNLLQAIDKFTICLTTNPLDTDARYIRAYAYLKLSKLDKACADLKFLSDKNQKTAINLKKEYCNSDN